MKAESLKISKVFSGGGEIHYVLPHFQRQYSWDKVNWQTLLDDASAIYEEYLDDREPEHFLGSLVVINDGTMNGVIPAFKLVDGQQRLTTISLLLSAFYELIEFSDPRTARKIQKLLINFDEDGDLYFKLLPTNNYGDRQAYQAILTKNPLGQTKSTIPQAYNYFKKELAKKLSDGEIVPEKFFIVLANCFQVVFIELDKEESPYKIFESLNARGKSLSQADLVRNYIAMRLPAAKQEKVFNQEWGKIESLLQESRTVGKSRIGELTAFIRHYLAIQSRILCSEEHIYARFRDRCEGLEDESAFTEELATLRRFSEYYNKLLRPTNESNLDIRNALERLNTLEIQTAYPFLLMAYEAFSHELKLSLAQFEDILTVLENYLVRRYICSETSNYLNKMFPTLWRDVLDKLEDEELEAVEHANDRFKNALRKVIVSKNYPSNRKVKESIRSNELYDNRNQAKVCLILETINRHLSKETGGYTVLSGKPTLEHIMPQKLTDSWKVELGENFDRLFQDYLHTLGNLTLVTGEWNSALSNLPFFDKKSRFEKHALCLNKNYFSQEILTWNEGSIIERSDFLAEKFLEIWGSLGEPTLNAKVTYGRPNAVIICGERLEVPNKTWKQLRVVIMEWILKNYPKDFEKVKQTVKIFIDSVEGQRYPNDWTKLSNSVWMYHSASAKQHLIYYRRLLAAVGVSESEWRVEELIE